MAGPRPDHTDHLSKIATQAPAGPDTPMRGKHPDPAEQARRDRNQREDEARAAAGVGRQGDRNRDDRRGDDRNYQGENRDDNRRGAGGDRGQDQRRDNYNRDQRGRDDRPDERRGSDRVPGTFRAERPQDRPEKDLRPRVGDEMGKKPENAPENKIAKLILELGKISVSIKSLCNELLMCTKLETEETTDSKEEKERLTQEFAAFIPAADELRQILVAKQKPILGDLEIAKAQTTVVMFELMREVDTLDTSLMKLPEQGTPRRRRIELAKNEIRKFIGDVDSITEIPSSPLKPIAAEIPRLPNHIKRLPLDADDAARNAAVFEADRISEEAAKDALLTKGREAVDIRNILPALQTLTPAALEGKIKTYRADLQYSIDNFSEKMKILNTLSLAELEDLSKKVTGEADENTNTTHKFAELRQKASAYRKQFEKLDPRTRALLTQGEKDTVNAFEKEYDAIKKLLTDIETFAQNNGTLVYAKFKEEIEEVKKPLTQTSVSPIITPEAVEVKKPDNVKNAEIVQRAKAGEVFTLESLTQEGYSNENAETMLRLLAAFAKK